MQLLLFEVERLATVLEYVSTGRGIVGFLELRVRLAGRKQSQRTSWRTAIGGGCKQSPLHRRRVADDALMLHRLANRFAVGGIPQPRRIIIRGGHYPSSADYWWGGRQNAFSSSSYYNDHRNTDSTLVTNDRSPCGHRERHWARYCANELFGLMEALLRNANASQPRGSASKIGRS